LRYLFKISFTIISPEYGTVNTDKPNSLLGEKYAEYTCRQLRRTLKSLKAKLTSNDDLMLWEIKFVSQQLRAALKPKDNNNQSLLPEKLKADARKNFWKTCISIFDDTSRTEPGFGLDKCVEYFKRTLSIDAGSRT
jgi:hypothetical protein